jgi:intein/homing endonuclease
MKEQYIQINEEDIPDMFEIEKVGDKFKIKFSRSKPIFIKLPFILDEKVATLAGLMPDGSLIKDLMRIYFGQKKYISKVYLFIDLLKELFNPESTLLIRKAHKGGLDGYTNSQTLCKFLYFVLNFTKSDEEFKIPKWVFESPRSVKITYIREAFAMEGCVEKWPRKIITLVNKPPHLPYGLQKMLLLFGIKATVKTRIGGLKPQLQYKLFISGRENLMKFQEIGFTYQQHKERFKRIINFYENKTIAGDGVPQNHSRS